jgi:hypothetical protein
MSVPANPQYQINSFFEIYAKALRQRNTKLLAFNYMLPCTMISDDTTTVFTDISKLEGFFNQGVSFYKHYGIAHAIPDVWSKQFLTEKIAQVKVIWQYLDSGRNPLYSCNYYYVIKLNKDNQWKIVLSVSVDEKEKMEEWKTGMHK